jgi:copper chaperone
MSNERGNERGNERATTLEVQGMSCPSCIDHISSTLTQLGGVGNVDVELRAGLIVVKHDAAQAPVARLIEALGEAGYEAKQRQV